MPHADRDTIFALSSGRPPAAIAVVRTSGPQSRDGLQALVGKVPEPRRAMLARLRDPASGDIIDEALALWFPAPNSETGEDVAELQLHGGRAVIAAVLTALGRLEGFRPAEAGEFTRRAFENGRVDLTAVEGLADLISAETEAQRRQALRQLRGALRERAEAWRTGLIEALALVEAGIDFSDEGDVPRHLVQNALNIVRPLADQIDGVLAAAGRGERLREGYRVAIAGPPNAGKSTLLNWLAQREAAIVSPFPGTTRDVIEVHFDLGGYPVTLLDTAGIRQTDDPVEQEGVRRAQRSASRADLILWVIDASAPDPLAEVTKVDSVLEPGRGLCVVVNKIDLIDSAKKHLYESGFTTSKPVHFVSAATGEGADKLVTALTGFAQESFTEEPALVVRQRQAAAVRETSAALKAALARGGQGDDALLAEDLRIALRGLGRLTGRVDVEEILDVIFRDFCIGK
jgi:tRNA modification GTPase